MQLINLTNVPAISVITGLPVVILALTTIFCLHPPPSLSPNYFILFHLNLQYLRRSILKFSFLLFCFVCFFFAFVFFCCCCLPRIPNFTKSLSFKNEPFICQ